jgi:glycosyltransferase involved in cell wall biosynthesis
VTVDLSILIVNYKNSATLPDCLDSIYKTIQDLRFEVILVDNGSGDAGLKRCGLKKRSGNVSANSADPK